MHLELFIQILSIVSRESDLDGNKVVKKIKEQLEKRDPPTYEEWKKENFNINYQFIKEKFTLLHIASLCNQKNIVKALLEVEGIDVNLQDKSRKTPLHLAIKKGDENIVKALLAVKGIDVNFPDVWGKTPLYLAIEKGDENIVKALLAVKGIDVNFPDNDGKTPLYLAAKGDKMGIVKVLLEKGADPLLSGYGSKTLEEIVNEITIDKVASVAIGTFIIASVVAAIVVTSAYFIGVSLSVGAMAGIAVAAAVLTGLIAGGITYVMSKPSNELNGVDAQPKVCPEAEVAV